MLVDRLRSNVEDLLRAYGRTKTEFAQAIGVGSSAVTQFLKGGGIGIDRLDAMCEFFKVDVGTLFLSKADMRDVLDRIEARGLPSAHPQSDGTHAETAAIGVSDRAAERIFRQLEAYIAARLGEDAAEDRGPLQRAPARRPRPRKPRR